MGEAFMGVAQGFGILFSTPILWIALLVGLFVGLIVGALPGLGATAGIALILPFTYAMDPTFALIFVSTLYVGSIFGGSAPSILFNMPGEASAAVTAIDGYPMRQKGEAAKAIGVMVTSSATGGVIGALALLFISPLLINVALSFGPLQYFALILLAITVVGSLGMGSTLKGYAAGMLGLLLATVGSAPLTGQSRFTFGNSDLSAGISYIPVMIGAFALAEVFVSFRDINSESTQGGSTEGGSLTGRVLTWRDFLDVKWVNLRSSILGTLVGILPGAGATPATFIAYSLQQRLSKTPERLGKGAVEGVAAPEAANNSAAMGTLVPLLTLGIPGGAVAAVMYGIFQIHGLQPGPLLFVNNSDIIYALMAALLVANAAQLVIGVWQAKYISKVVNLPKPMLYTIIACFCIIGAYAINNRLSDVWIMLIFGFIGFFMRKYGFSVPALVLGLILGGILENSFGQAVILTGKSPLRLFIDPIAGPLLVVTALLLLSQIFVALRGWRRPAKPVDEHDKSDRSKDAERSGVGND